MAEGERQAKLLIRVQQSEAWLAELRKFDIRRFRLAIGWLTGHWTVNYHFSKVGLSRSANCKWFHVEEEITEHLLCEFQVWVGLQLKRTAGRAGSRPPGTPSRENKQEVRLKDDEITSDKSRKVKQTMDSNLETSKT